MTISINKAALKACQGLWRGEVLPAFNSRISHSEKARIAYLYVCLMTDARDALDLQAVEIVREKYRELTNYITEVKENERRRRKSHDKRAVN